jgi:hypothetical protein
MKLSPVVALQQLRTALSFRAQTPWQSFENRRKIAVILNQSPDWLLG